MKVKNVKIGESFELIGHKWKVLDITEKGYVCLMESQEGNMQFDRDTNNWQASDLRNWLNIEFLGKLAATVGAENIIPFERNLLSLDGLDTYGTCEDKVSLLNLDEYRKYRRLIPMAGGWWWLVTPDSTKENNDTSWITVVGPSGSINYGLCDYRLGVRPFCIFSSSIFESEE